MMTTPSPRPAPRSHKVFVACLIGTALEWWDFFLYSMLILHPELLFPDDPTAQGELAKVMVVITFMIGFVARPLGALIFAYFGERKGRRNVLMATLLLMGLSTVSTVLIPYISSIGSAALVLLVLERFAQGLSLGGEWGGAVELALQHTIGPRRGITTSFVQLGVPVGLLCAYGTWKLAEIVSGPGFESWGWQLPFLLSFALVVAGLWIRYDVAEPPSARQPPLRSANLVRDLLSTHVWALTAAFCARIGVDVAFYLFALSVLHKSTGLDAVLIGSVAPLFVIPLSAALSDRWGRWGRYRVYLVGVVATGTWAFIFFRLLGTGSPGHVYLAVGVGLALHAVMYGPQAAFIADMFHPRVRYIGLSMGYQLPGMLGGAVAPFVANWIDEDATASSLYLLTMLAVTVIGLAIARFLPPPAPAPATGGDGLAGA